MISVSVVELCSNTVQGRAGSFSRKMRRRQGSGLLILLAVASCIPTTFVRPASLADHGFATAGGRRLLLGSCLLGFGAAPAQAQSVFSNGDKWDGSFLDTSRDCKESVVLGTPEGTCLRNSNALGGYATIRGRDTPGGDEWEVFSEYDGSEIVVPFKERGGPKAVGKWFNNKKEGVKGVKWDDGTVWEKMDYKIFPAPNEFTEALGKARNEAKAAEKGK